MIETNGNQMFNVPATKQGKKFIKMLRKHCNKKTIRVRGRGSRKRYGSRNELPINHAEWLAVYIKD